MHNVSAGESIAALKSPSIPDTTVLPGIAPRTSAARSPVHALLRPDIRGKFIFADDEKLFVRGVTYGAFRPDAAGREYQNLAAVERDFAHMAACGLNAVRIPHTMPERPLLDAARRQGLRVMVGLSAEQYLGFLIDGKKDVAEIAEMVRAKVRTCAGHRALLCYSLGNEIPAPIARWLGRRKIERYLECLYHAVKEEDPGGLVTYVNYPTTEYLQLPFLDFVCFNVYLESKSRFESYLARLQNIAGNRPLMMSELDRSISRFARPSRADAPARSYSRGPTSGTGTAVSWRIGPSVSPVQIDLPSRRCRRSGRRLRNCRSRGTAAGRASPCWCAPTTERARSAIAWMRWSSSTIRITR